MLESDLLDKDFKTLSQTDILPRSSVREDQNPRKARRKTKKYIDNPPISCYNIITKNITNDGKTFAEYHLLGKNKDA